MKEVNLISLSQAFKGLSQQLHQSFFEYYGINPKKNELEDLGKLIEQLQTIGGAINICDNYFFGYKIPQISKEFDLLRFGDDYVINIELKSENTGIKIEQQIIQNGYYLSFLNKKIFIFTYVSSENKLYRLDNNKSLIIVSFKELYDLILAQNKLEIENIDNLFNPTNYLVSPFNSTNKFIAGGYFLTGHQEHIKKECLKKIGEKGASFISIIGKAGTGKTLLTFDIAKDLITAGKKVLIIHCGKLNQGHLKLQNDYQWDFLPIKHWHTADYQNYELVILDETQRAAPNQLRAIIAKVRESQGNCIFSYDQQQCLRISEVDNNITQLISNETASFVFTLTDKIRTNKEIASFIGALFNRKRNNEKISRSNIDLIYFQTPKDATEYLEYMSKEWKIINYTPSLYYTHPYEEYKVSDADTVHDIIGQEFDKVIAVIDKHFYYDYDGNISIRNYRSQPHYHPIQMLFQILTRTRRKLCVVVINNDEIMERCLSVLGSN